MGTTTPYRDASSPHARPTGFIEAGRRQALNTLARARCQALDARVREIADRRLEEYRNAVELRRALYVVR